MFGLKEDTILQIQSVFKQFSQVKKVLIYGSRSKDTFHNGSDIDLTLIGNGLSTDILFQIDEELEKLMLPYKIDISIMEHIDNKELIDHIDRMGQIFYSV